MGEITTIGLDLAKQVFQVHGIVTGVFVAMLAGTIAGNGL
jgi:hypothetical protein